MRSNAARGELFRRSVDIDVMRNDNAPLTPETVNITRDADGELVATPQSRSTQRIQRYRARRKAAGECIRNKSHGPATRGVQCEDCAERQLERSSERYRQMYKGRVTQDEALHIFREALTIPHEPQAQMLNDAMLAVFDAIKARGIEKRTYVRRQ